MGKLTERQMIILRKAAIFHAGLTRSPAATSLANKGLLIKKAVSPYESRYFITPSGRSALEGAA